MGTRPAELEAIRERLNAAVRGPWVLEYDYTEGDDMGYGGGQPFPHAFRLPEPHTERGEEDHPDWDYLYTEVAQLPAATAEFIVHAHEDVRRLLDIVDEALGAVLQWGEAADALGRRAEATTRPFSAIGLSRRALALTDCANELQDIITAGLAAAAEAGT